MQAPTTSPSLRYLSLRPTDSPQPPTQAGSTRRRSVLVGTVVVPRYPLPVPVGPWTFSELLLLIHRI